MGAALKYRVEGYGLPADDMAARAEREAPRAPSARFIRLARDELCRRLPGIGNGLAEAAVKGMAGPSQTVMTLLVQAAGR